MADGIDFALGWHEKTFAVMAESMRQAGEPELGIEMFCAETEAALCACAYAVAAMVPADEHRQRLRAAARRRIDEQTGSLVQFDAYLPAIDAIDGDTPKFTAFFFEGLPDLMLDRLDQAAGAMGPETRNRLGEIFHRVAGDIARWTAEHRQKHTTI